jgi:hypothetical protein
MSVVQSASCCPFCQAAVPPKTSVCPACQAHKQARRAMSPRGFKTYALTWLACTIVLVVCAAWLALLPWLPDRDAPPYALRLLGAAPMQPRCTVEVLPAPGAAFAKVDALPCAPAAMAGGPTAAAPAPDPTRRRIAATLHGALVLSLAALLSWMLQRGLKAVFMRPAPGTWVRRSA